MDIELPHNVWHECIHPNRKYENGWKHLLYVNIENAQTFWQKNELRDKPAPLAPTRRHRSPAPRVSEKSSIKGLAPGGGAPSIPGYVNFSLLICTTTFFESSTPAISPNSYTIAAFTSKTKPTRKNWNANQMLPWKQLRTGSLFFVSLEFLHKTRNPNYVNSVSEQPQRIENNINHFITENVLAVLPGG